MNLKNELRLIVGDVVEWSTKKEYIGKYNIIDHPYLLISLDGDCVTILNIETERYIYFMLDYLKRCDLKDFIKVLSEANFI